MFSSLRKSLDRLRPPVNRDMATETSVVKVHPDTTKPNIAWDKLKVKQKVEKVTTICNKTCDKQKIKKNRRGYYKSVWSK